MIVKVENKDQFTLAQVRPTLHHSLWGGETPLAYHEHQSVKRPQCSSDELGGIPPSIKPYLWFWVERSDFALQILYGFLDVINLRMDRQEVT